MPIVKLEVEGMKYAMYTALSEHAAQIDENIKQSVDAYCTSGNIASVIDQEVRIVLDAAIKEEIRNFFRYSTPGRLAIREAIEHHLNEVYPVSSESELVKCVYCGCSDGELAPYGPKGEMVCLACLEIS